MLKTAEINVVICCPTVWWSVCAFIGGIPVKWDILTFHIEKCPLRSMSIEYKYKNNIVH